MLLHIRLLLYLFHNIQLEWHCIVEVGPLTEKLNRYPMFLKTDTDTNFWSLQFLLRPR